MTSQRLNPADHFTLVLDYEIRKSGLAGNYCALVLELDGTLSGEHGVGLVKRDYIKQELDPVSLGLMQRIKRQFDPKNILNPGKSLPDPD